jgi:hypothetical protein
LYNTVTGEEITGSDKQKAQSFAVVATAVGLASAVLYLAFKDDEDFKKRDEWDRDNFWWIKLPGMDYALRIPKPFEIGAIGTLIERTLEQIFDSGAEGKQFTDSLFRTLSNTFALNPSRSSRCAYNCIAGVAGTVAGTSGLPDQGLLWMVGRNSVVHVYRCRCPIQGRRVPRRSLDG